jgi:hypothetical protein
MHWNGYKLNKLPILLDAQMLIYSLVMDAKANKVVYAISYMLIFYFIIYSGSTFDIILLLNLIYNLIITSSKLLVMLTMLITYGTMKLSKLTISEMCKRKRTYIVTMPNFLNYFLKFSEP